MEVKGRKIVLTINCSISDKVVTSSFLGAGKPRHLAVDYVLRATVPWHWGLG